MDFIELNDRVEVVCLFRDKSDPATMIMPAKMKWRGREVIFTELGLRHPSSKGHRMVHVFDMSGGGSDYRLEFDAEMLTWTLVAILEGSSK